MTRILPKVAEFKVDGAEGRLDLAPGVPLPDRPREDPDDTDYESLYGVYYDDDGNRIPEYVDDEDVPALEDAMSGCETPMTGISTDTEQAGHMGQLSLTSPYHPGAPNPRDLKVRVATSSAGSIRKVRQVAPQPPKFDQLNVKQLVSEVSRQVTQSVVDQLTGLSPADAQADLNIRQALAATRREESAATFVQPDSIPAILRAMRTGGEGAPTPVKAVAAVCGQPAVPEQNTTGAGGGAQGQTTGRMESGSPGPPSRHKRPTAATKGKGAGNAGPEAPNEEVAHDQEMM